MKRLPIEVHSVTPDEACELVIHHLRLAAAYFEATPHDQCVQLEIFRLIKQCTGQQSPTVDFVRVLHREYENMKRED